MILRLLRAHQWYKNLVILLPLIFVGHGYIFESWVLTLLGFFSLCLMSSTNYIVNDVIDRKKDLLHPEKKSRPLASAQVSVGSALFLAIFLFFGSILLGLMLSPVFACLLGIFFLSTLSYSLFFKNEVFIDLILISSNFVIRAIGGAFILGVVVSPWLILCTFFLSLFLITGKRYANIRFLGEIASKHKKVLQFYSKDLTRDILLLSAGLLIFSYSLYSFQSLYPKLIYTLPVCVYVVLRYLFIVERNSPIARNPHLVYKDLRLSLGILLWIFLTFLFIY
jgi:4-hydroxybenzoate polyprenyltransferase